MKLIEQIKKDLKELETLIKTDPLQEWLDKSKTLKEK